MALYCIIPNRNLQGLPKHLNGHPKVSEQNLLNMVWGTIEKLHDHHEPTKTSQHELDPTKPHTTGGGRGIPSHQTPRHRNSFPPTRPHTTGKEEGGFLPTTPHTTGGEGAASSRRAELERVKGLRVEQELRS